MHDFLKSGEALSEAPNVLVSAKKAKKSYGPSTPWRLDTRGAQTKGEGSI